MKYIPLSLVLVFLSALTATAARAQNAAALERRAGEVCGQFRQTPGDYDKMFAPSFLAQVPARSSLKSSLTISRNWAAARRQSRLRL